MTDSPCPHPDPQSLRHRATGLRRKIGLLLLVISSAVLLLSVTIGQRIMHDLTTDLSRRLAVAEAQLTREKIQALVGRELAMAQRFAGLSALMDWLLKEQEAPARTRFLAEAAGFRQAFADQSYFVIHHRTLAYYYADPKSPSARYRYTLDRTKSDDGWYFSTMNHAIPYTLNINPDATLKVTNLWINVQVRNAAGMPLGLVGTGMQLDRFLKTMLVARSAGAMSFIVDAQGRIVAHPDAARIEYGAMDKHDTSRTVFAELSENRDRETLARSLAEIRRRGTDVSSLQVATQHGTRMMALAHLPELGWTVVSSVNPAAEGILSSDIINLALVGGALILILVILTLTLGFDRLVLHPLLALTDSARRLAMGRYETRLQSNRNDEIGALSRAFDSMAAQVQAHTAELEQRVAERTAQLESTHAELATTHRQLTESIRYASLIQRVILPDRQLSERLRGQYFVVWHPRDVVGGDFYLYREQAEGCLFGVIDCAGHGVPGAFMTMIAHAALERATLEQPWNNPAALLESADKAVRSMMPDTKRLERLATSMDIGLCFVEWKTRQVHFSGAHIDLFVAGKTEVKHFRGDRGGINDRRPRPFTCQTLDLEPGNVFYLVTDGILDQSGGDRGLPFGRSGFVTWIRENSGLPLEVQEESLTRELSGYRGDRPQRDDITVLAFRFESPFLTEENAT
ncbi:biofilm regulation protein phosphatase SiaA [Desulfomicrobium sp. ZS1]|uniref:biofilm regulation protein phosphatase SiaA n=1 Tax=Desulfomicrobium sp. ZS1 TaxID=2952228 RepID=UPI0020B34A0E|nr:biofilm regulation protein phosphatase SiaA [Desulfomicrobium sp. ZS1]UTF51242.1 biofilm regulation protein phosphatase SiaA [Desulfomicrobium sp. ZS1]